MTADRGGGYFTIQGIKNRMQYYDVDGDQSNLEVVLCFIIYGANAVRLSIFRKSVDIQI